MLHDEKQPLLNARKRPEPRNTSSTTEPSITCAQDCSLNTGVALGGIAGGTGGYLLGQAVSGNTAATFCGLLGIGGGTALGGVAGVALYGLGLFCVSRCTETEQTPSPNNSISPPISRMTRS